MIAPLGWIRRISPELLQFDAIPLFGRGAPFDWHRLSSLIASHFATPNLAIHAREQTWREAGEVKKALGMDLIVFPIVLAPLGSLFWIMSREDVIKFTSRMLNGKTKTRSLPSEILQEGFYRYLLLEVLDAIQSLEPLKNLTLHLSEEENLPEETSFCVDIEIDFNGKSCWGRLAIPATLRKAWIHHFDKLPSEYIPTELAHQTQLIIGVKTGSVLLERDEWENLKEGDFVILDKGSYDAHRGTGVSVLMLGSTPLFNVKIKQNKIELVDYAFYYEENMDQKRQPTEPTQNPVDNLQPAEGEVVALKELPLFVTVELARLKITLDQLMHLNPGNMLELPIHPDESVSLTVNGQKIGRAELVYLGETLGLRILEIG